MHQMTKNVIYLISSPLAQRDYERFGIEKWLDRGWEVLVFDVTKIVKKDFWNHVDGEKISVNYVTIKIFETDKEALSEIDLIKGNTIFIDILEGSLFEEKFRGLAKQKGQLIKLFVGVIPSQKQKFIKYLTRNLSRPKILLDLVVRQFYRFKEVEPDYVVVGGSKSEQSLKYTKSKIIRAHNLDYDFYINDSVTQEKKEPYILFLDEDACYHSDYIALGIKPCGTPSDYFPKINSGLHAIAKKFNLEVIVAAHPRSSLEDKPYSFEFPVQKNNTYDLVKNASLVIAHGSTAIQFAIILRKPILLVTTNELEAGFCSGAYKNFRSELNKSIINFDNYTDKQYLSIESSVDDDIYDNYFQKYIKQRNTPNKPLWNIVIDQIEADHLAPQDKSSF